MSTALLLHGGPTHDFAGTTAVLVATLREAGFDTECHEDPDEFFAALRAPTPAPDLVVVHALRWSMSADRHAGLRAEWAYTPDPGDLDLLARTVEAGAGLLALHTAVICFDGAPRWAALTAAVWDWNRSAHPPLGPVEVEPTAAGTIHPVTETVAAFSVLDELYHDLEFVAPVDALLVGRLGDAVHPLLWATTAGAGRVVTSLLGHGVDSLEHPCHHELLRRAARWAVGQTPVGAPPDHGART